MLTSISDCSGAQFILGTEIFTEPGDYMVFVTAANGCDSIYNLSLEVLPENIFTLHELICSGDIFIIGGNIVNQPGDYTFILEAANGCDSIVNLSLTVVPDINSSVEELLCSGDVYIIGGDTLNEAGNYSYTLQASNGCDSLVQLTLLIDIVPNSVTVTGNTLTADLPDAFYRWFNCDTGEDVPFASDQSFTPTVTGNYAVYITDQFGCTGTSECIHVVITSVAEQELSKKITLYPNPANDRVFIVHDNGYAVESVTITDVYGQRVHDLKLGENSIDVSGLVAGMYLLRIKIEGKEVVKKVMIM